MAEFTAKETRFESGWDSRQQYAQRWYDYDQQFFSFFTNQQYDEAMKLLLLFVTNISQRLDDEKRLNLTDITTDIYQALEAYDNSLYLTTTYGDTYQRLLNHHRRELETKLLKLKRDITNVLDKAGLLLPVKKIESFKPNREDILPAYIDYIAEYEGVDEPLATLIGNANFRRITQDDDVLWFIAGQVGSGKSMITHHVHDISTLGTPNIANVAFDNKQFPNTLNERLKVPKIEDRFVHYDEADVNKRASMTNFNKDLIATYNKVRGKHGFHCFCDPSINGIDKPLVEERIDALIYTFKKPRGRYMFFDKAGLLKLCEAHGKITQPVIETFGHEYAIIKNGRFNIYPQNDFKKAYDRMKEERQDIILDRFAEKHAEKAPYVSMRRIAGICGLNIATFQKIMPLLQERGAVEWDKVKNVTGKRFKLSKEDLDRIRDAATKIYEDKKCST